MAQAVEVGRQRDYRDQCAAQLKQELVYRKQLIAQEKHVAKFVAQLKEEQQYRQQVTISEEYAAKARDRLLKAQRVGANQQRVQAMLANRNLWAEEKRQERLARVAQQDVEAQNRLTEEIMLAETLVQQRQEAVAEVKQERLSVRAQQLEQKMRRAESAKSTREIAQMERVKARVAFRDDLRDMRAARARDAKEKERLEYVRRNAEEESRRVKGINEVMQQEAEQQQRLVSALAQVDMASKVRLEQTASEKLKHMVELAQQREEQLAKAAETKAILVQRVNQQISAAAAIREERRNEQAQRAMEAKQSQRMYYSQRNAIKGSRFEQGGQEIFEAAIQIEGLRPHTASAAWEPRGGSQRQ